MATAEGKVAYVDEVVFVGELWHEDILLVSDSCQWNEQTATCDFMSIAGKEIPQSLAQVFNKTEAGTERTEGPRTRLKSEFQREGRTLTCKWTHHNNHLSFSSGHL